MSLVRSTTSAVKANSREKQELLQGSTAPAKNPTHLWQDQPAPPGIPVPLSLLKERTLKLDCIEVTED